MKTYPCACGAELFATNTECSHCGRPAGWCDVCHRLVSVTDGRCDGAGCGCVVVRCGNGEQYNVCNGMVTPTNGASGLCSSCQRTHVIPDLTVGINVERWRVMERAKRRLLYELRQLGFGPAELDGDQPLVFEFKADTPAEKVITGHANGVITLNLAEADPVYRERQRAKFAEPQRTIIGHLRHEFGHFWYMKLVEGERDDAFKQLFGNPDNPTYATAMPLYYEEGPPSDWQEYYVSEYASAHPWEDFAETAGFYQDAMAMIDTLRAQVPSLAPQPAADFAELLSSYQQAGISLNEIARTMGLTDTVPEVISALVLEKLRFVHDSLPAQNSIAPVASKSA